MSDPTESNKTKPASKDSEEGSQKIFTYSNDAILIIDPARDKIIDANPKACSMLGYSRDELLATRITAIHPNEMPQLLAFTQSVLDQGHGWTNELSCMAKSGKLLPAEISASVIKIGDSNCIIALVRDITERKRTQEALQQYSENLEKLVDERTSELRRSEERQRALLEINNAIIANLNRESLFTAVTQALRKILTFDVAAICLLDREKQVFRLFALEMPSLVKHPFDVGTELELKESHVGWVLEHRKPLLRCDLETERQFPVEEDLLAAGIRSYLAVPLVARGDGFGTLNIGRQAANCYSDEDGVVLEEVGKQVALAIENMVAYEEIAQLKSQLEQEKLYLQEEIKTEHNFEEIIGQGQNIKRVLRAIETVAPTDASVLVLGETGTGKELVARAIHNLSPRKDKALVKVNCAALPSGLIESELFGHEKGAFTGALSRRIGRFELAHRGTIFLDEIGDLPLELQAKLLRVLQDGEFERVGGTGSIKVNVRVIAATNRDLERSVQEDRFRQDLFYRLNVFPIRIPSLRERKEDIALLVKYFAVKYGKKMGRKIETIPQTAMDVLLAYGWPGNVRELENVIERSVILSPGTQLELGEWLPKQGLSSSAKSIPTLEELEREHIIGALERTGWRVSGENGAAKLLNIKPTTLDARIKKLGIKRER
ncbi:MAG: sigma 54-interacting transcriptional regulator [Deltaproteobacteria bacterium]|nr:sigma 54-interacting transcriptional regulator [Deltaproteobacteria bacterium]